MNDIKHFVKFGIFLQALFVFLFGPLWLVGWVFGKGVPLIVLPIAMVSVFAMQLLTWFVIIPVQEWWMSDGT